MLFYVIKLRLMTWRFPVVQLNSCLSCPALAHFRPRSTRATDKPTRRGCVLQLSPAVPTEDNPLDFASIGILGPARESPTCCTASPHPARLGTGFLLPRPAELRGALALPPFPRGEVCGGSCSLGPQGSGRGARPPEGP